MFLAWKRVSCILRYLGRGRGAPPLFLLLSLKGWQPPFCLSVYPRAHDSILFTKEEITNRSTNAIHPPLLIQENREEVTTSLSYGHALCLSGPDGRGTMQGNQGQRWDGCGNPRWNRVTWLLPLCKKCMLIRGGFRETVFGGKFSIRISSHAYLILYEMFLRSRKLIIFNKKRKWELSSKVQNLAWQFSFFLFIKNNMKMEVYLAFKFLTL